MTPGTDGKEADPFTIPLFPLLPLFPPTVMSPFEFALTELPPFELIVPVIILVFMVTTELLPLVLLFKLSPVAVPPLEFPEIAVFVTPELVFAFKAIGLILIAPVEVLNPFTFCELPPDIFGKLVVDEVVDEEVDEVDEVVEVNEDEVDAPVFDGVGFVKNLLGSRLYFLKIS